MTNLSATFSKQSGGGACGSSVSATVTYHNSLPASTPESQAYFAAISSPQYDYTYCLMLLHNECGGNDSAAWTTVAIYVDAPPRSSQVYAQAKSRIGFNTLSYRKNHGHACAYMVNMVQYPVTGITLSSYVPTMVSQMEANPSVFQPVTDLSTAVPGDIVVKGGGDNNPNDIADPNNPAMSHVGICANNGCTEIDSNSDGNNQFMNNYHNGPPMDGVPSTIFHVN